MSQSPAHTARTANCCGEPPTCGHGSKQKQTHVHVHIYRGCSTGCGSQGSLSPGQEEPVKPDPPQVLPIPEIATAVDHVLKLGSPVETIEIKSQPWDFIQEGQERYFACTVKNTAGVSREFKVAGSGIVSASEVLAGVVLPVAQEEVERWRDGDTLTVILVVTLLDKSGGTKVIKSEPLVLTINRVLEILYENFDKQKVPPPQLINVGGVIDTPTMTITQISGTAPCGVAKLGDTVGLTVGSVFTMGYSEQIIEGRVQLARMNLKQTCSRVELSVVWLNCTLTITFYNATGAIVGKLSEIGTVNNPLNKRLDFTSVSGSDITAIELHLSAEDTVGFDNFVLHP